MLFTLVQFAHLVISVLSMGELLGASFCVLALWWSLPPVSTVNFPVAATFPSAAELQGGDAAYRISLQFYIFNNIIY